MTTESVGGRGYYKFGVGDRIRAARESKGLSQDDLARLTGISRQTISNYELGLTKPKPPYLAAIAVATAFDREWIEHGTEPDGGPDGGDVHVTSPFPRQPGWPVSRFPPSIPVLAPNLSLAA